MGQDRFDPHVQLQKSPVGFSHELRVIHIVEDYLHPNI